MFAANNDQRERSVRIRRLLVNAFTFCCLVLSLILFSRPSLAATISVPADYSTIQAGIDAASDGDIVLVADGTYTGKGNKNLDYKGKVITVQSENGPENCVIDCERAGRGFCFQSGEGSDSVVSGLTITNCWAVDYTDPEVATRGAGGGILCSNGSSPTISNCHIIRNVATLMHGGGIFCFQNSSPTINNCVFSENIASTGSGGGIGCSFYSNPTITNCTITGNTTFSNGAGLFCWHSSSPIISNCVFRENTAKRDSGSAGGIYCGKTSSPILTNCTISENTADTSAGGIYCWESSPSINNCVISGNRAGECCPAGGILCDNSSPSITGSTISNNSANVGAGIYVQDQSSPTITNCVINGNIAKSNAGAILVSGWSDPVIVNCTITGNLIDQNSGIGGIYFGQSSSTIINSILWGNLPDEVNYDSDSSITYSDVRGGFQGVGNINSDPLFEGNNDYHLTNWSPCINAGSNATSYLPETDKDGNPRRIGGTVDIGAYEYLPTIYVNKDDATCGGKTPCYITIQQGIDAANSEYLIKIAQGTYDEEISLSSSKDLTLQGGWNSSFTIRSSTSTLNSMTISNGTVTTEYLVIQ